MKLTDEQVAKIMKDFPAEALSKDTSRGFELTSIKAMYVILRLNDVFGITGWGYEFTEPQERDGEYFTKVTLKIYNENETHSITQYGGKKVVRNNITDAYKSAITDGLTKCASILGIGHKVFKGEVKAGQAQETQSSSTSASNKGNVEDTEIRDRIVMMVKKIFEIKSDDDIRDKIEYYSGFQGKDGWVKGKRSTFDLSGKWLRSTYAKIKTDHETWKKEFGEDNADYAKKDE